MGIGKSNFDGNSLLLSNVLISADQLQNLQIDARLKFMDATAITLGLRDSTCQLKSLKLTAIALNEASLANLSKFFLRQKRLKHVSVYHVAEGIKYYELNTSDCLIQEIRRRTPYKLPEASL